MSCGGISVSNDVEIRTGAVEVRGRCRSTRSLIKTMAFDGLPAMLTRKWGCMRSLQRLHFCWMCVRMALPGIKAY